MENDPKPASNDPKPEPKPGNDPDPKPEPKPGNDPDPKPEPKPGSDPEPKPADGGQGGGEPEDKHGNPGINREKYQRDMKAKDDKIAELQAQLDEKAKTEEGRAALKEELDKLKAEMADEKVAHKLEMAGCLNAKAAKALLGDYDGDVAKLKDECPYLFSDGKKTGSTGLKPEGGAGDDIDAKLDRAMGIKE